MEKNTTKFILVKDKRKTKDLKANFRTLILHLLFNMLLLVVPLTNGTSKLPLTLPS